ncbi:TnsA-like heteromeric transposase endonuclease subunit [Microbacterium tenebrionis]|uniref:TnsA-like heteromeric transposase endonuclease subunit n=1 Tax=Microbacterium tenebrionis TaxID=2830665 RepID=UPI00158DCFC0|nr:TnsA-like heteromeric transposase endonuclease subunit [Microbacterium ihumii]
MTRATQLAEVSVTGLHAQIEFTCDGDLSRLDASDVLEVAFESVGRVRTPASWKHKRNYQGLYWAATIEGHVWFESLYERAAVMRLDRDRDIVGIAAQPMWIHWALGGKHAPDYFVRYRDGRGLLIDVKPDRNIGDDDARTFALTADLCDRLGWGYTVVSDISIAEHRNLRFLSGYRYRRWAPELVRSRLYERTGEGRSLAEWADLFEDACEQPLGAVYSAMWWGDLDFDVRVPLSLSSRVAAA